MPAYQARSAASAAIPGTPLGFFASVDSLRLLFMIGVYRFHISIVIRRIILIAMTLVQDGTLLLPTPLGLVEQKRLGEGLPRVLHCGTGKRGERAPGVDDSAWTEEGCFDGETPEDTWRYLNSPHFEAPGLKSILRSVRRKNEVPE